MKQFRFFLFALPTVVLIGGASFFGFSWWKSQQDIEVTPQNHADISNQKFEHSVDSDIRTLKNELAALRELVSAANAVSEGVDVVNDDGQILKLLRTLVAEQKIMQHEIAALQLDIGAREVERWPGDGLDVFSQEESPIYTANTIQEIETGFSTQEPDLQWSTDVVSHIDNAIEQLSAEDYGAGAYVTELDCRSSLCKLELVHDDPKDFMRYELMLALSFVGHLPEHTSTRETDEHGRTYAVYYMARNGYDLGGNKKDSVAPKLPPALAN